jgi:hypothetical protein
LADIFYVESGYLEPGYFVYTADAGSSLTSAFRIPDDPYVVADYTVSGYFTVPELQAKKTVGGIIAISSAASVSAEGTVFSPIRGSAAVESTASLTGVGGFSQSADSSLSTSATLNVQVSITRNTQADLFSTATVTAEPGKIHSSAEIDLEAFGNISLTASAQKNFVADLSTTSTMTVVADRIREPTLQDNLVTWDTANTWNVYKQVFWDPATGTWLHSYFDTETTAFVRGNANIFVEAEFSVDVNGGYLTLADSNIASEFSQSANGGLLESGAANIQSTATVSAQPTRILPTASADLSAQFSVEADTRIPGPVFGDAALVAEFSQLATANYTAFAGADLNTSANVDVDGTRTQPAGANISAQFAVDATSTRIQPGAANFALLATVDVEASPIFETRATAVVVSSLSVNAGRLADADSNLQTTTTTTILGGVLRLGTAAFVVDGFVLSVGDVFTIDPDFQLRIAGETRFYPVIRETRLQHVPEETRLNIILPDTRDISVDQETRILSVL